MPEYIEYDLIEIHFFGHDHASDREVLRRILHNQHIAEIKMSELSDALTILGGTVSEVVTLVGQLSSGPTQAELDAANAALAQAEADKATIQGELDAANAEISADAATITSLNAQLAALVPAPPAPVEPPPTA